MKLHVLLQFWLAATLFTSCNSQRQILNTSIDYREQLASEVIAEMLRFELGWRLDIDPPIFVDTVLKVRGNIYSHDSLVFGDHVDKKRRALFAISHSHDTGVLRLPKSLQDSIYFLSKHYDLEQDSVDFRFYSLPILIPEYGIYVMELFSATQGAYTRDLGTACFCFDFSRKAVECPQDFGYHYFPSNYWLPILQPRKRGAEHRARADRYNAAMDRKKHCTLRSSKSSENFGLSKSFPKQ